ncbi:hypothetical protein AVEN_45348-1 [Araneus ventricosus]|uniref:ISXO2-like transposase domain-containing protein n=1 Tax=Araneus ventricosus TaxID=182803 RepID=A0A4Y2M3E8_ARAVE|nr:hypothetical protein AVEN_45348-1 [Araneus ventricosus]
MKASMDILIPCGMDLQRKLGWISVCTNRHKTKCSSSISPLTNTFFVNVKLSFRDVLITMYLFVKKITEAFDLRVHLNEQSMCPTTLGDMFSFYREIAEVFSSNNSKKLGGQGKTILLDETFLTKRKYRRRRTKGMTQVVLGIYCREDKEGLFFLVKGKERADFWPFMKKHCHPETSVICTDSTRQYYDVQNLFQEATHKRTNHKIGQFVDLHDRSNTINDLDNENKHLKKSVVSRRTPKMLPQYKALHYYRRT